MPDLIRFWTPEHAFLGVGLVLVSGMVEYLFPPYPGDTLMLFGFFLAARGDLPFVLVFGAAMVGSLLGAELAYRLGRKLGRSYFFIRRSRLARRALPALERYFDRFGNRLLLINRFLPVLRGFFLYAAGMGRMPRGSTFVYANLSNLAWILLIAWVGNRFGASWERLQAVFRTYTGFIGVILLFYLGVMMVNHYFRRGRPSPEIG